MSVPAMPIDKKHYDYNVDFRRDTANNQQHEEELNLIANGQSSPSIWMKGPQHTAMYGRRRRLTCQQRHM